MTEKEEGQLIQTIGHSNLELQTLISMLKRTHTAVVADVRTSPRSRYVPHFNQDCLQRTLAEAGIDYLYLGDALGGRPVSRSLYTPSGVADYEKIAATGAFQEALQELETIADSAITTILCTEKRAHQCHRALMVGHALHQQGWHVVHLHQGNLELPHQELIESLRSQQAGPDKDDNAVIRAQALEIAWRRR